MKVLTFTSLFPNSEAPDFGIFIKNRMKAFSLIHGDELRVVAPVPWFPPLPINEKWFSYSKIPKYELIDGIEVYHPRYLVTPKIGMTLYGLWMFVGSFLCLKKIEKEFPFELIDAHFVYPDGLAAILLGRCFNRPVVVSARGTDINLYPQMPLIKSLIKAVLKKADCLISVSKSLGVLMECAGASADKIKVIPNGIDPQRFFPIEMTTARRNLGLGDQKKVLLAVGGLIERKGFHLLVDAMGLLKKQGSQLPQTYILGEGEYRQILDEKIQFYGLGDEVKLVGHVSNEELSNWYNAADLFFLGSSREGWPNVVCEAQACGVPVVSTAVHGVPEILTSDELGILVERTPAAFARGIMLALNRDWDRGEIAQLGQQRTWQNVAAEVHSLFKDILKDAKN